jgi:hypothetical protein
MSRHVPSWVSASANEVQPARTSRADDAGAGGNDSLARARHTAFISLNHFPSRAGPCCFPSFGWTVQRASRFSFVQTTEYRKET